jgi:hypothetical protein
MKIWHLMKLDL